MLRRLAWSIFVLFGLSVLIFVIARVIPGDPARMALGPRAPQWAIDNLVRELHLNEPIYMQYWLWLKGVFHGDLGISLVTRRPVLADIVEFLPATVEIILVAAIVETVGGILLGALSARYSGSWFDSVVRIVAYLGVVTPAFVWAIIFVLIFGYLWPVLPIIGRIDPGMASPPFITGLMTIDSLLAGDYRAFHSAFLHLILPSFALAMGGMAQAARITRSSMSDNLGRDYVGAEVASGIPQRLVILKYVLRPSLIPTVSIIALDIAAMLGNAFLVELVFNYPGISRYGINAMLTKDLNAIVSVIMVIGLAFVLVNIVVDVIVAYLDPRIRLQGGK
ncbi:peptide ABC transporter [Candidatus Formimonas warabiya]|uniref:Peptide ABC transporter n=1 Tax=Formimonas warabiya TaxID=1761012 RepID=A0A3G1L2G3_FORW1|nr:peptide ABC transporter [Candidatus Formimonas warabiya]